MKDCKDKHFFSCADESFKIKPVMCITNVNRVSFDFTLKAAMHYPTQLIKKQPFRKVKKESL